MRVVQRSEDKLPSYICDEFPKDGIADTLFDSNGNIIANISKPQGTISPVAIAFTTFSVSISKNKYILSFVLMN